MRIPGMYLGEASKSARRDERRERDSWDSRARARARAHRDAKPPVGMEAKVVINS